MSRSTPPKASFVEVDHEHAGQRLDNFLLRHLKGVPRTLVYRIIRKGEVRINKGRARQTTRLQQGDIVRIPPLRQSQQIQDSADNTRYQFLSASILFEDEALMAINKPSGMAVHGGSGIKVGIIEALRMLRPELKYLELVHRLDRETSGCLLLAKKSATLRRLHEDFKHNSLQNARVDKRYLALVRGRWKYGQRRVIKNLNTEARRGGERHVVVDQQGSYASSIFSPRKTGDVASLVEVKLLTGRTHQVRVHAQSENHPLAGDQRYGDPEFNRKMKKMGLKRLFLHAHELAIIHPLSGERLQISAALPPKLCALLEKLEMDS